MTASMFISYAFIYIIGLLFLFAVWKAKVISGKIGLVLGSGLVLRAIAVLGLYIWAYGRNPVQPWMEINRIFLAPDGTFYLLGGDMLVKSWLHGVTISTDSAGSMDGFHLVSALLQLCFGFNLIALMAFNSLLAMFSALCVWKLCLLLGKSTRYALLCTCLFYFFPAGLVFELVWLKDTMNLFLSLFFILCMVTSLDYLEKKAYLPLFLSLLGVFFSALWITEIRWHLGVMLAWICLAFTISDAIRKRSIFNKRIAVFASIILMTGAGYFIASLFNISYITYATSTVVEAGGVHNLQRDDKHFVLVIAKRLLGDSAGRVDDRRKSYLVTKSYSMDLPDRGDKADTPPPQETGKQGQSKGNAPYDPSYFRGPGTVGIILQNTIRIFFFPWPTESWPKSTSSPHITWGLRLQSILFLAMLPGLFFGSLQYFRTRPALTISLLMWFGAGMLLLGAVVFNLGTAYRLKWLYTLPLFVFFSLTPYKYIYNKARSISGFHKP